MELQHKSILILGGSGLVGQAVARRVLARQPAKLTLVALYEDEVRAAAEALQPVAGDTQIETAWGNVFLPVDVAQRDRRAVLADPKLRAYVIDDLLSDLDQRVLQRSFLYRIFQQARPHAVVDCINTATAFAYQDVFTSSRELLAAATEGGVTPEVADGHVLSIPIPQLIRHVQILLEVLQGACTESYVKIGTSGTGGMGLNIPYTHSEERPSRTLLAKSAVAGAHSLLLFLMARTPGAPAVVEIKPTAAIGWREIAYGPVRRRGRPITRFDCPEPLALDAALDGTACGWQDTGSVVESVFADVGENGLFARDEFETVTALGQMEFITPEEIADYVLMELQGRPTGHDIVAALDSATAGPTYRAGLLRSAALDRLEALEQECGVRSVAFEMLGPPRLTKLLYEAHILSQLCNTVRALADASGIQLAEGAARLLRDDPHLRSTIISVGLPILLASGNVYRADEVIVWPQGGDVERAVARGWVDLRAQNCAVWIERARRMVTQWRERAHGSGSNVDWHAIAPEHAIRPAAFATWIFRYEDQGERIKR